MSQNDDKLKPVVTDEELDDLLNSALKDFDKKPEEQSANVVGSNVNKSSNDVKVEEIWNEEFVAQQSKLFEEKMAALFGGPNNEAPSAEEITVGFQKMAEAAALALKPETENLADPQFTQSISEALKGLSAGQENLQSPFNPEDITRMFSGLDMNEGGGDSNQFLPFMQGMMQSLLSAEVLLPSLKDLVEKYPKWLEENDNKIDAEDKKRYQDQQKLMELVCAELETERPDDSSDVKKQRFNKVLENMQKMQDLGQPPADLVGDVGPPGMPTIDPSALNDPSQCCVM